MDVDGGQYRGGTVEVQVSVQELIVAVKVRLLQSLTLLVTTNTVCSGDVLARCLVICFRLAFSKENIIATTGGATVRHLVTAVFDRTLSDPTSTPVGQNCSQCPCGHAALWAAQARPHLPLSLEEEGRGSQA